MAVVRKLVSSGDGLHRQWLAIGRMMRILSVVNAYKRECLALQADTSLGGGRVTRVLKRLMGERGWPENVRSDNGPSSPLVEC